MLVEWNESISIGQESCTSFSMLQPNYYLIIYYLIFIDTQHLVCVLCLQTMSYLNKFLLFAFGRYRDFSVDFGPIYWCCVSVRCVHGSQYGHYLDNFWVYLNEIPLIGFFGKYRNEKRIK